MGLDKSIDLAMHNLKFVKDRHIEIEDETQFELYSLLDMFNEKMQEITDDIEKKGGN